MKVFLVDGSALLYRSHFAFVRQPLTNTHGEITSAAFGTANALLRLVEEQHGDAVVVAYDAKGKSFRHEMYEPYKAQRPPMPRDLSRQVPRVKQLVRSLGIPIFEEEGFEADDVIATLALQALRSGHEVWIYSSDKDFIPLVRPGLGILKPAGRGGDDEVLDERAVVKKFGVRPSQYLDVLALMGDTSDNVPGVPGIGEKTALKLIAQFQSLNRLLERLDDKRIPPRQRKLLADHADQIQLSRSLLTIVTDVPVELDLERARVSPPYPADFLQVCRELEFFSLLQRTETRAAPTRVRRYRRTEGLDAVKELADALRARPGWVVATETAAGDAHRSVLIGLAFALGPGEATYVPLAADGGGVDQGGLFAASQDDRLAWAAVKPLLAPVLEDAQLAKGGHDVKTHQLVLARHGVEVRGIAFDTMIASHVFAPERRQHDLISLAADLLGESISGERALFEGLGSRDRRDVPVARYAEHACQHVDATLQLWEVLRDQLEAEGLSSVLFDLELPLTGVLLKMERTGIRLDVPLLDDFADELRATLDDLTARIYELAGEPFNLNSPQQLSKVLFEKLGLKPGKKTSSGYSTDVAVLTRLAKEHELPNLLLEYRQRQKLLSTYVEALPKLVKPSTGCLHTHYGQAVAATGRLSSADPNLQNIPIRTDIGRRIREAFVPREPGWKLLAADYSQIELRLMAHLSGDTAMREAFRRGEDIHARTAALVNHVDLPEVTPEMRRRAKAINFGLLYGMGARALAQQIDAKTAEAAEFIEEYFASFPAVRDFIRSTIEEASAQREVRTLLGRRRRLPELASSDPRQRAFGERIAVNTPIQGSAADLIKLAMIRLDRRLEQEGHAARILLQVHDELVLEVDETALDAVSRLARDVMENVYELAVPLVVDVASGANWAQAHP